MEVQCGRNVLIYLMKLTYQYFMWYLIYQWYVSYTRLKGNRT